MRTTGAPDDQMASAARERCLRWHVPAAKLPQRAVEEAVRRAFGHGLLYYRRLAFAEAVLDRPGDEFRLLTYSEFLRRYEDPEWNSKSLLGPVRQVFSSLNKERLQRLEQSLAGLSNCVKSLTDRTEVLGKETASR